MGGDVTRRTHAGQVQLCEEKAPSGRARRLVIMLAAWSVASRGSECEWLLDAEDEEKSGKYLSTPLAHSPARGGDSLAANRFNFTSCS